eukprot:7064853-Prymnesium_polylepis.2
MDRGVSEGELQSEPQLVVHDERWDVVLGNVEWPKVDLLQVHQLFVIRDRCAGSQRESLPVTNELLHDRIERLERQHPCVEDWQPVQCAPRSASRDFGHRHEAEAIGRQPCKEVCHVRVFDERVRVKEDCSE